MVHEITLSPLTVALMVYGAKRETSNAGLIPMLSISGMPPAKVLAMLESPMNPAKSSIVFTIANHQKAPKRYFL